jgi:NADH-quinone oxidoreductase subunit F
MATTLTPILSAFWDDPKSWSLETYTRHNGYKALDKALAMEPAAIIAAVKDSSLRGRGGAGFPTGMKWSFMAPPDGGPRYLVVNADESEPGTCKDIPLMMANPHVLIEGVAISSFAIGCEHAFIYLRGEVVHVYRRLLRAVEEAYEAGHLGKNVHGTGVNLDITVHAGAGAYICGEETALLDSLEGRRGQPRSKPPFPGAAGLYARPTSVNNVESIASVPGIILEGVDWFTGMGTEKSTGFGIFSLSGHVKTPGQYEAPLGITLRELIDMAGGMRDPDKALKFWTPGGSSTPLFTAEHLDVPLDFESVGAAGSMLGTRALQIFDETVCVVRAVDRWTEFYKHESCGKCTPCREGTWWLKQITGRLERGEGTEEDIDKLLDLCDNILGRSFCALADGATSPVMSSIQYFRDEYIAHLTHGGLPVRPEGVDPVRQGRKGPRERMTTTPKTAPPAAGAPAAPAAAAPPAADQVTLTIDDREVSVAKGTLIIRAAEQAGIEIPRFCDHPGLDPVGACRQCLVEVWMPGRPGPDGTPGEPTQMQGPPGRMKPQASCTMTVAPGMVVKTQYTSEGADKAQQGIMEFLLINHPLDCPVCDKGGECPLQNQAMSNGRATSRFEDIKRTYPKPINISSQVLLDRERCVLCARCTRFSDQIAGDPFIALVERGALQQVGIYEEQPFESYFSGNTVQICPVGALTGAAYRFRSRPFDLVSTPSVCEHCASGCAQRTDHRRGTVLRRMARPTRW